MSRWRATMPKEKPEDGEADFVVAVRKSNGIRIERTGTITNDQADHLAFMKWLDSDGEGQSNVE